MLNKILPITLLLGFAIINTPKDSLAANIDSGKEVTATRASDGMTHQDMRAGLLEHEHNPPQEVADPSAQEGGE